MKRFLTICSVIVITLAATVSVQAAIYGLTSRADLAGDDVVNWGQQGYGPLGYSWPHYTPPYIGIPAWASSANGIGLYLSNPPYNGSSLFMSVRKQSFSWFGNFAPGDYTIGNQWDVADPFNRGGPGPLTIDFDVPVYGLGAQINQFGMYWTGAFSATIEAFDYNWNSLGQVNFNNLPFNGYTADGSAPFIGIVSDANDIAHVVIATGREAHVINHLSLLTAAPPAFPPMGAIPSSPGTASGARVVSTVDTFDATSGAMLTQAETLFESEWPFEKFPVNAVDQPDPYTATITYNGGAKATFGLLAHPARSGTFVQLPIDVQINGAPGNLADLEGETVKKLASLAYKGSGYIPELNEFYATYQYVILADLVQQNGGGNNDGGGNDGGGNDGGNQDKAMEAEGRIKAIGSNSVLLDKEGTQVLLTVDNWTLFVVNEQRASLSDLQTGDKAKAEYNSSTKVAAWIMVER